MPSNEPSIMWSVGRFILKIDDITVNQQKALDIFAQCIILEAKILSPVFFMPEAVQNKIVYTARSYQFERIKKTMKNIPWYDWTYEDDKLFGDINDKSWQATKIKTPHIEYK